MSGPVADLEPKVLSLHPVSAKLGDEVVVTTRVYNHGDAFVDRVLMRFWVSRDHQFDGGEIDGRLEDTYYYVDSIPAQDSIDVVRHMVIDNDWGHPLVIDGVGQYYVVATIEIGRAHV